MNKARAFRLSGKLSYIFTILLAMMVSGVTTEVSFANSAEPPAVIIVVPGATDDLVVSIEGNTGLVQGRKVSYGMESQFMFYNREIPEAKNLNITVASKDMHFELSVEKGMYRYRSVYTIDTVRQTIIEGTTFEREATLVATRVGLTLIIEGAIFWLFGFRSKRAWLMFLLINLLTQGALNLWLGSQPLGQSYLIFGLAFAEIFVLISELFLFNLLIKEHTVARRNSYVVLANFASLILGGYLITWLPI